MKIPLTDDEIKFLVESYDEGCEERSAVDEIVFLRGILKELRPHVRTHEGKDIFYRAQCMGIPV